jgi:hypothetical protein
LTPDQRRSLINKARTVGLDQEDTIILANELEIWVDMALRVEESLHAMIKKWEGRFTA